MKKQTENRGAGFSRGRSLKQNINRLILAVLVFGFFIILILVVNYIYNSVHEHNFGNYDYSEIRRIDHDLNDIIKNLISRESGITLAKIDANRIKYKSNFLGDLIYHSEMEVISLNLNDSLIDFYSLRKKEKIFKDSTFIKDFHEIPAAKLLKLIYFNLSWRQNLAFPKNFTADEEYYDLFSLDINALLEANIPIIVAMAKLTREYNGMEGLNFPKIVQIPESGIKEKNEGYKLALIKSGWEKISSNCFYRSGLNESYLKNLEIEALDFILIYPLKNESNELVTFLWYPIEKSSFIFEKKILDLIKNKSKFFKHGESILDPWYSPWYNTWYSRWFSYPQYLPEEIILSKNNFWERNASNYYAIYNQQNNFIYPYKEKYIGGDKSLFFLVISVFLIALLFFLGFFFLFNPLKSESGYFFEQCQKFIDRKHRQLKIDDISNFFNDILTSYLWFLKNNRPQMAS